jgi:hypothetical protein
MKKCNECGQSYDDSVETCNCGQPLSLIVTPERIDEEEIQQGYPIYRESIFKKILKGGGCGGLIAGLWIFNILQFLYVAVAGLSMIGLAIKLFSEGSIIWGLVVLLIGTPIAIGLAGYFFIFFFVLTILALIIWGISHLFGFNVSFLNVWDIVWFSVKTLILGGLAFVGIAAFINAIRERKILGFFKEYWWGILLFCFLFWLFFHDGFTGALTGNTNQTAKQGRQNPFESLNSYELDKYSTVMAQAFEKPLASSDLENLRAAIKSYVSRTGNYLTKNDIDTFIGLINKSNDYLYELGQSLLFSWDQHQPYTTNRFDELYKEMQKDGCRKPELLQSDKNLIQEAAQNPNYTEDANGNKYEFSRETILENLSKIEIARKNHEKMAQVFGEFVK